MIVISHIQLSIETLRVIQPQEHLFLRYLGACALGCEDQDIQRFTLIKKSIDARHKPHVQVLYRIAIELYDENLEKTYITQIDAHYSKRTRTKKAAYARVQKFKQCLLRMSDASDITHARLMDLARAYVEAYTQDIVFEHGIAQPQGQTPPTLIPTRTPREVVIVGAGCAGLFSALWLARTGASPILIERGRDAHARMSDIKHFIETGELNEDSNIQFGIGGAGTFSDGKLNTGTKSPYHRFILETFVEAGAPKEILWMAKPHIGSDILHRVVTHIVASIQACGGEVLFHTKLTHIDMKQGRVYAIRTQDTLSGIVQEKTIPVQSLVLACGHSARDTYRMLQKVGVFMERKTFAVGFRIEHLQETINRAQYGSNDVARYLGAADYKLAHHLSKNNNAFTFCMCPGGYVVCATSTKEQVVTNGMSLSSRANINACAGYLSNIYPEDLDGGDVLAGMHLQDTLEKKAYALGGGAYRAPAQLVADFLKNQPSSSEGRVHPSYAKGVTWTNLEGCMTTRVCENLRQSLLPLDHKLKGFAMSDAVLTGVETRSSAPVRITRNENLQSINTQGLFCCGEGAGYAGGIMSAATDGIRVAQKIIELKQNEN